MRLICVGRPLRYASSFFGIVDLLAIIPTYISLLLPGSQYLVVIRILRVLRVFRILKLVQYLRAARIMVRAIRSSHRKIAVFTVTVMTAVVILGSLMYVIEKPENGFTSIPRSIYWAVVTLTTVGYGDISPKTAPGQALAVVVMMLGYSIIAVPTGILSVEISQAMKGRPAARSCSGCNAKTLEADANYCRRCGTKL
jgi:voltage-gated potassium channel